MGDDARAALTAVVGLLAALMAAGVALWNEARRRRHDAQLENDRRAAEREQDRLSAVRAGVAEVFREMFVLQHEVEWLCWHARHDPARLDRRMVEAYTAAVHASIPRLLGSLGTLASLDLPTYDRLLPTARRLFAFEGRVGLHVVRLHDAATFEEGRQQLDALQPVAAELWEQLPVEMHEAMRDGSPGHGPPAGRDRAPEPAR